MFGTLVREIQARGDRAQIVAVERLTDLQQDILDLQKAEDLNGFQKFITHHLYRFEPPVAGFAARSVLIVASPTPAYAKVNFHWQGRIIPVLSLVRSYPGKKNAVSATRQYLTRLLKPAGYHVLPATNLPLKRLAARSGLAQYGRNNICYVEGMGSFFTLVAYFSDIPCRTDHWHEIRPLDLCQKCAACINNCPTGAIRKERFLINNERCLSFFNESAAEFPEWLPRSVHHCLYDCLRCQTVCPQNKDFLNYGIGPVEFDEAETDMLLAGKALPELPPALRRKVRFLGMDQWLNAIPRNMRVLFENQN